MQNNQELPLQSEADKASEFLKASSILMPLLKAIPKEAVKRHGLLFKEIIEETMQTVKMEIEQFEVVMDANGEDWATMLRNELSLNLAYYVQYGKSKEGLAKTK